MNNSTRNLFRAFILFTSSIVLSLISCKDAQAQEIIVKDCHILATDETAANEPRKDGNGDLCALLKIKTNDISNLQFPNANQYMGDVVYREGYYYVYIPTISYKLTFRHPDYVDGLIDLAAFGLKKKVQGGKTYEVVLYALKKRTTDSFVSFKVTPYVAGCKVTLDGDSRDLPTNGVVEFTSKKTGFLHYSVMAPKYNTQEGSVNVTASGVVSKSITMHISTTPVTIKSNIKGATVYVDDVSYGKVGILNLPYGSHKLRLSANGYIDGEEDIFISSSNNSFEVNLEKNKGQTIDIHPINVIVHCSSSNLYKNNKRILYWSDGHAIQVMPNSKCRLSDDYGKGAVLKTGDTDMEIKLSSGKISIIKQ